MASSIVNSLDVFAPAKLNLFLAITGQRTDGFHDLVSVAAPLAWGDTLTLELGVPGAKEDTLECNALDVPSDESNLVLKAARIFREATGWRHPVFFELEKRIPVGAGLGGGSSDAAAALRGLNSLAGELLSPEKLAELAPQIGSDCALFFPGMPVVMRGRGERVEPLPGAATRLQGRRILVFKPPFGIATPWAYRQLAAEAPASYLPADEAEARLAAWLADPSAPIERLLFNNMERAAFTKFLALPALLDQLRSRFSLEPLLSGSGSACFALLPDRAVVPEITAAIRTAWGEDSFVQETAFAI